MSKKSETAAKLLDKIQCRHPLPQPLKEGTLLEQALLAVLVRHVSQEKAEAAVGRLRSAYPDWNEMRVAQIQEIAGFLSGKGKKASRESLATSLVAAREARDFLQEVFQKTHALDLAEFQSDPQAAGKLIQQMPLLGMSAGSYLLWLATNRELPVHGGLIRVLDRLGLISRTASMKKARDLIDPLVSGNDGLRFVSTFSEVAELWCDARRPICQECVLVDDCPYGKKAYVEWKQAQVKLEAQRARDEARRLVQQKKDDARRLREAARAAKLAALEEKKRERERAKRDALDAKGKAKFMAQQAKNAKNAAAQKKLEAAQKGKSKKVIEPAPRGGKKDAKAADKSKVKPKNGSSKAPVRAGKKSR
ncbi:MAG: hypothetical protein ACKVWV_13090 [Planctomycetota bacterium]